ncbi:MAG: HU family DNA-binding protein [Proteobacteria bacterium]|nr:HU family DNA-binding protein [Pseudomonadota bacterium]
MNKTEFVGAIAKKLGITKSDAANSVNAFFDAMKEALISEGEVRLIGFGSFKVVNTPSKIVRNPQTGEDMPIPEKKRIKFVAGKDLKDSVN